MVVRYHVGAHMAESEAQRGVESGVEFLEFLPASPERRRSRESTTEILQSHLRESRESREFTYKHKAADILRSKQIQIGLHVWRVHPGRAGQDPRAIRGHAGA